jgi:hypothetical protein
MSQNGTAKIERPHRPLILRPLIGPILIFLLACYLYFLAGKIDAPPSPEQLGAAFWPKMILLFLMISCGIKGGEILWGRAKGETEANLAGASASEVNTLKLVVMIFLVIAAVYFMDVIGFPLANFLFLLLFMRIAGLRKKTVLFLTSFFGTILLLYLFVKVVYLPLPKGQWLFDDMTIGLYRILHII